MNHRRRFDLTHAKLMDIDRAMSLLKRLQPKAYAAIVLVGRMNFSERLAGKLVGVDQSTMNRRYRHGIKVMTDYLNVGRTN